MLIILQVFQKILFIYFRQRGREGEREEEKHQCVVAFHPPSHWGLDLAHNPGMCPAWESTGDPLVHRLVLSPLSHTSQDTSLSMTE